jgi:hypothetical protein
MTFYEFQTKLLAEKATVDCSTRYHGESAYSRRGTKVMVYKDRKRARVCHCRSRGNSFFTLVGGFYAIHLVLNAKKGIRPAGYRENRALPNGCSVSSVRLWETGWHNEGIWAILRENATFNENSNAVPFENQKSKRGTETPVMGVKEEGRTAPTPGRRAEWEWARIDGTAVVYDPR